MGKGGQRRILLCWVPQPVLRAGEMVSEGMVPVFKPKSLLGGHEGGGGQVTVNKLILSEICVCALVLCIVVSCVCGG